MAYKKSKRVVWLDSNVELCVTNLWNTYKVVQIWPGLFVCKQVTVCPGHIWTTLYVLLYNGDESSWKLIEVILMSSSYFSPRWKTVTTDWRGYHNTWTGQACADLKVDDHLDVWSFGEMMICREHGSVVKWQLVGEMEAS